MRQLLAAVSETLNVDLPEHLEAVIAQQVSEQFKTQVAPRIESANGKLRDRVAEQVTAGVADATNKVEYFAY